MRYMYQYTANRNVFKCSEKVFLPTAAPSDSPEANSTPASQPQKKPAGHKVIMAAYLIYGRLFNTAGHYIFILIYTI